MKRLLAFMAASALLITVASPVRAGLINGGFEQPFYGPGTNNYPAAIPGWQTNDGNGVFEIWGSGFGGFSAYEGTQFAELNAYTAGTLWQDVAGIASGARVGFQFAHRGRAGVDVMRFTLTDLGSDGLSGGMGAAADTVLFTKNYSDGTSAWGFYNAAGESAIFALGNVVRFSYTAVSAAGGISVGNFLDAADFGVGVGGVPASEGGTTLALLGAAFASLATLRRKFARA